MDNNLKRCSCCGELFPKEQFGKNCLTPDGLAYYSKPCSARKQREYRETHPEEAKASRARYLKRIKEKNLASRQESSNNLDA